jgi:sigma-B regulation protein RsbU (phosphoserine phosphatase)
MKQVATDEAALNFFVGLAEDLNSTLELDELLPLVAERVRPYVGFDAFGILLLDSRGTELRFRFGLGYAQKVLKHWRFGLGQGIVGNAASTRKPILVEDVLEDPRYINADPQIRSELAIPLIAKNSTIGVLDVQSQQPGCFTQRHRQLLTFVAGYLANAIENVRLYENLREQTASLSLLNQVGRELTSILDREQLLNKIAELVRRVVDYQVFSVLLWDEEHQVLLPSASLRSDHHSCERNIGLGEGLSGSCAALRQPVRVSNVHLDPRYVACGDQIEVRSELAIPLVFKDRLIGVLDLESTDYNAFSDRHEAFLSTLASYIAVAIENASLYDRLRRDEQRLADDLAQAREIQSGLLTDSAPSVSGLEIAFSYCRASHLGGDIYDFLPYDEDRLAIMVGDVAGKATAAALQGSMAIGVMRGHVVEHHCEPADMLRHINEHLLQPSLDNRFVAMAYAIYDRRQRMLAVANAGFPRPHLVRDGQVEELPVQGIPLGLMADTSYEQKTVGLRPGDVIIFCSDGIHEIENVRGEQFGVERLPQVENQLAGRSAQHIADGLKRASQMHGARTEEPEDDQTVVVLKVID